VLRVRLVMEPAAGERPADALVEEQEEQRDLDAFWLCCKSIGAGAHVAPRPRGWRVALY